MPIPRDFKSIKLKLASPDEIVSWSYGEVKKPETINYRTQRPEKDGLFSERIFGPTKDWECYCGKYKRIRYKGIVCDKCGVEVTRSIVRRERMGHIKLAAPVAHIWFLRGVPSKIGTLLDLSVRNLERVVYFTGYIIISVDEKAKEITLSEVESEFKSKKKLLESKYRKMAGDLKSKGNKKSKKSSNDEKKVTSLDQKLIELDYKKEKELESLRNSYSAAKEEVSGIKRLKIISEIGFRDLSAKYGHLFQAGTGAEALWKVLSEIDLKKEASFLEKQCEIATSASRKKIKAKLRLIRNMSKAGIRPEWMILTVLPVLPPDLRPMVQLDGGRFAASDLNDLYRRVINRNNRLKRLVELNAPEVICRNEKRMLQEAVDALIDNSVRLASQAQTTKQKRPLKSLADMLKGKQGRFRQNLLGKRVDYSGRSVIVIGPELRLSQCGIPKIMALELFKPFVINKLIKKEFAHNVRAAGKLIEEGRSEVWDMLEEAIQDRFILLNRAPTLHRLGIQAFRPVLIEGKAIQIHPMVCSAFNADFDGDQMAVHLPLTLPAQTEAKEIMNATKNLLKPATGMPITTPTQDVVLGCYYITNMKEEVKGSGKYFSSSDEAVLAYENRYIDIRAKIKVKINEETIETCAGRIIFNKILPKELGFINKTFNKKALAKLIAEIFLRFGQEMTIKLIDEIKNIGFNYLTKSGLSWGMDDLQVPKEKSELFSQAAKKIEEIRQQYRSGLLTDQERYVKVIETWADIKNKVSEKAVESLDKFGPVYSMVNSSARGSWAQVVQMTGMRGLMAAPSGKTIELPVKNSFKEGLGVLEYFISTHGARKGLTDTALRTSNAGYLTRRLVDVAQDMTITSLDCGTKEGTLITKKESEEMDESLSERVLGRTAASDVKNKKGKIIIRAGEIITSMLAKKVEEEEISEIKIRTAMNCRLLHGICQKCYGWDLAYNKPVELGTAVGIIAAQSIGEPGTQLTMRTFHTGGVAGVGDITQGLPRVEELFEARGIRQPALISEIDGKVYLEEEKDRKILRIVAQKIIHDKYEIKKGIKIKVKDGQKVKEGEILLINREGEKIKAATCGTVKKEKGQLILIREEVEEKKYNLPKNTVFWVATGDLVARGQQLTEGPVDLHQLFKISGREAVQKYILREVQYIYSSQGQDLNDKHLEIIIRQMFSWCKIKEGGDSDLLPGDIISRIRFDKICEDLKKEKKQPPEVVNLLLGITKASFATEGFLSAASFQETARVLIDAAVTGKVDELRGLKENVIIGKLIPAGTGFR
ncbi:MAG: DNA-directed RNA polymerase subunit beta', partial [Patescibacteria group bacterium]